MDLDMSGLFDLHSNRTRNTPKFSCLCEDDQYTERICTATEVYECIAGACYEEQTYTSVYLRR